MSTTLERVKRIISQQVGLPIESVTDTATLTADLGADSLDEVELLMALEDEFCIEIPDEPAEQLQNSTAPLIAEAIDKHLADLVRL